VVELTAAWADLVHMTQCSDPRGSLERSQVLLAYHGVRAAEEVPDSAATCTRKRSVH
jgi:hypothetical protein